MDSSVAPSLDVFHGRHVSTYDGRELKMSEGTFKQK
jgi:hypothetical protein